jgi:hypothetical protein
MEEMKVMEGRKPVRKDFRVYLEADLNGRALSSTS